MLGANAFRPEPRSQVTAGVCSTCLAADRLLFSIQITPQFINICNGLSLSAADMICYECRAILGNFVKFRDRALHAQRLLLCVPASGQFPQKDIQQIFSHSGIACLSNLTRKVISAYDAIFIDGDLLQVKLEGAAQEFEVKPEIVGLNMTVEPFFSIPDSQSDVKSEMTVVTGEPTSLLKEMEFQVNVKSYKVTATDTKIQQEDESGSEDEEPQVPDPLILKQFEAKHIELAEVLTHMESIRKSTRYKRAPYKCDKCAVHFKTEPQYKAHIARHATRRGRLVCDICELRFKKSESLALHTPTHYTQYACRHCARCCDNYIQMYFHYRSVHDQHTPRLCNRCPARFTNKRDLKQHAHRVHGRTYPCPSCDRQYATATSLHRHLLVHDSSVPELECDVCHKKYKGEFNLRSHVRNVHELKPGDAYCVECDMQFKDPQQYRQHLKTTSRHVTALDYKYECDHCGKKFTQKPTLTQHIEVVHLKLAQYKCEVCGKAFHTKRYAANHTKRKHSEEPRCKKHVCHICAKAFTVRKSLDEHMNAHLGLRPFECKICGAAFAYNSALFNHNQLVHLKKVRKKSSRIPD